MSQDSPVLSQSWDWLERVVIGLNLCPFAAKPHRNKQIKMQLCEAKSIDALLDEVELALNHLNETPASVLDTTVLVIPHLLQDFFDYNDALDWVEDIIDQREWRGVFQIASFHPNYQFAGTAPDDPENLTNRAPYPMFHLIREASMTRALASFPDHESIPERNIAKVESLTEQQKQQLFSYLYKE